MSKQLCSEKFVQIINVSRTCCAICGVDIVDKNFKLSWKTILTVMLLNCGISVTLYTIYIEAILMGEHSSLFKSLAVLGSGIQGYAKLITVIKYKKNFRFLYEDIKDIYETYERKSPPFKECLRNSISFIKKLMAYTFFLVVILTLIFLALPVISYTVFKNRVEILPYKLPFVDATTEFGYCITSLSQIVCVFFAAFGNFAVDSFLFIYVAHIPMMKNMLKCKLDDLDEASAAASTTAVETSNQYLKDVFKWHQKCNSFTNTIRDTFFWIIFVQISTEFFGIVCAIVCIFLNIWPAAAALVIYLVSMIYSYCVLGNLVESANDEITDMIYDCSWYNLTMREQKLILIMLRESQQATGLTIGGVAPLSLNTALQLTKTIYTFSMMLKESFE